MAITQTFDSAYPDHPWSNIATKERQYYDPVLRDIYYRQAVYSRFVSLQFPQIADHRARTMTVTSLIPPHANSDSIDLRQLWLPSSFVDSFARTITFEHLGGKLALHKFDDMVTYWQYNNRQGLIGIINKWLGRMMVDILDKRSRNAFIQGAFAQGGYGMVGPAGAQSSWNDLNASHTVTTDTIDSIHLGMGERGVPYAAGLDGPVGNIICLTSPGVIYNLQREADASLHANKWVNAQMYAGATRLIAGEVGIYHHIRFVQSPKAILYNAGQIVVQLPIKAPIAAGQGAPDPATTKVDGARAVGQAAATHYIQLDGAADLSDLALNDIVTIHVDRTNAYGVTNGVDITDGKLHERRIVAIDDVNKRLSFDLPIMEEFSTDLGGTVYGYVTKAHPVHTMTFLGGTDGIAVGVGQAPRFYTPGPVDDLNAMFRFTFDMYMGWQLFEPQVFEVVALSAPTRFKGGLNTGVPAG